METGFEPVDDRDWLAIMKSLDSAAQLRASELAIGKELDQARTSLPYPESCPTQYNVRRASLGEDDMAMRTIDVRFKSLEELPIAELFGVYGVYVLWAPSARDCPTYLGEGVILSRLNDHVKWLKSGVTGIAATVDSKREAEVVEATLLWVGEEINRWPTQNSKSGNWKRIDTLLERHTSLRVNIRGKHPFAHPTSKYSNLRERVPISVWLDGDDYRIDPYWNRRS